MHRAPQIILETAATLITLGGLYDLFVPRLPPNLGAICKDNDEAEKLVRELLRALGGALVAIGITVAVLVAVSGQQISQLTLLVILLLVIPSEAINALCMYRVGSPYYFPLALVLLTLIAVAPGLTCLSH